MEILDVILIGVALAMDAFALTVANCISYKDSLTKIKTWSMPTFFGLFQFLMPVIGFYIGSVFAESISSVAGFITAGIFFLLFIKIIYDNIKELREEKIIAPESKKTESQSVLTFGILILQAIATSIDALLIGASKFAFNFSSPYSYSLLVGIITFAIVSVALFIGKSLGKLLGKFATWVGAVILLSLALKELIQALI